MNSKPNLNPQRQPLTCTLTSSKDGMPLKRQVTMDYPLLTRRERRQLIRNKKAGK
jgi:hypothetical protein